MNIHEKNMNKILMTRLCIVTKFTLHQDCNVFFTIKRGESNKRDVLMGEGHFRVRDKPGARSTPKNTQG